MNEEHADNATREEVAPKAAPTVHERATVILAFLLVPIASWQVWIAQGLPNYHLQHLFFYPCAAFTLWMVVCRRWRPADMLKTFPPKLWLWLGAVLVLQTMASWQSASTLRPDIDAKGMLAILAMDAVKLVTQMAFMLFFWAFCCMMVKLQSARRAIVCGAIITFVILSLWVAVQMAFVYIHDSYFKEIVRNVISKLPPFIEAQWVDKNTLSFYEKGSYTLTLLRINGFFEESSQLANIIGVCFIPVSFGLLESNKKRVIYYGLSMLIISSIILTFCQSLTGILLVIVVLSLFFVMQVKKRAWAPVIIALCLSISLATIVATSPLAQKYTISRINNHHIKTLPRYITTKGTLDIIVTHPILGVGREWFFTWLHSGTQWHKHAEDREIKIWTEMGRGGDLAKLPTLIAKFGIPVIAFAFYWIICQYLQLLRAARNHPVNYELQFTVTAITVWLCMAIITAAGSLDVRHPLLFLLGFFAYGYVLDQKAVKLKY
jgi:hypothetical protein